ncbi:glycoside hydrolase family 33 protein [Xylariales sp. PMI_506]|nr:glycoside hydrolase family 33 protein [Xylariales sp. PMI_506]
MANFQIKRWTRLVSAVVDDPAKDVTPVMTAYVLFRSANMASPDQLSTGIGFHSFRIPSVVTTSTGRILAFAEGRRFNNEDFGDINLVYKRTKTTDNNGETASDWEGLSEVIGIGNGTWGNPTAVVDGSTIYLFVNWNDGDYSLNGSTDILPNGVPAKKIDQTWAGRRHLYLTQSTDDGATWSTPVDMTLQLTPDGWSWDAVGPGRGIVLTTGEIVIPAKDRNIIGRGSPGQRTWSYQSLTGAGWEGTITQTPDGNLYRNDRSTDADDNYRIVARGTLTSFSAFAVDTGLPDPAAEASTLLYNVATSDAPSRVIFLNSADPTLRRYMRVRISYDADAAKYNFGRWLSDAPLSGAGTEGGYSSMTKTGDKKIGALVESNFLDSDTGNRLIIWRKFNLSWILNG